MTTKQGYGQKIAAVALILCLALGGAVGYAEDAQTDALEGVMTQMAEAESMTIDAQFAVRQNGEDKITGDVLFQSAGESQYASAVVTHADGETRDMEMSQADETRVIRMGDEFYSVPVTEIEKDSDTAAEVEPDETAEFSNIYLETVVDQLFGTVTENMTVTEEGISLHLAGDEVPAILNLGLSMMDGFTDVSTATPERAILHGTRGAAAEAEPDAPMTLGGKVRIDRIDVDISTDGEMINGIQCSIVLTGEDAEGAALETEFAAVIRIYDVNATEPAAVDITGVEMTPVTHSHHGSWRGR